MKTDRNCGAYPIYPQMVPNFGGVYPGQMIPMPGASMGQMTGTTSTQSQDTSGLVSQINSLEQRVSKLESIISKGNYNNYNASNYQMM